MFWFCLPELLKAQVNIVVDRWPRDVIHRLRPFNAALWYGHDKIRALKEAVVRQSARGSFMTLF